MGIVKKIVSLSSKEEIEFKELDEHRLISRGYNAHKYPPKLPEEEYYTDSIYKQIDQSESDTLLLNVGLGRGKSSALVKLMSVIAHENKFIVVSASPFKSLVQKEYNLLSSEEEGKKLDYKPLSKDYIFRYMDFDKLGDDVKADESKRSNYLEKIVKRPVQLISMNLLLANPGEDYYEQAKIKQEYLIALRKYSENSGKKIIFIFDEIHETVHNFKPDLIPQFYKWRERTHKCIVSTATISEAVYSVLMHLANNTGHSIHCIEYKRRRYHEKRRADLKLVVTNGPYSTNDLTEIYPLKNIIAKGSYSNVQLLSYSKSISQEIYKKRKEFFGNRSVNLCTAEDNEYNPNKSNVGTRFKTGVNIPKDDLLIVILPSVFPGTTEFRSSLHAGIFNDGLSSILQALARKRDGGDIVVVVPKPDILIQSESYYKYVPELFKDGVVERKVKLEKPEPITEEYKHLEKYYKEKKKGLSDKDLNGVHPANVKAPKVQFPEYDTFNIRDGQRLLCQRHYFSGKLIYPILIYKAFADQLTNCVLKEVQINTGHYLDLYINAMEPHQNIWNFLIDKCELEQEELKKLSIKKIKETLVKHLKEVEIEGVKHKVRVYSGFDLLDVERLKGYKDIDGIDQILYDTTMRILQGEDKFYKHSREAMLSRVFEGILPVDSKGRKSEVQKKLMKCHKELKANMNGHELVPLMDFHRLKDDKIKVGLTEFYKLFQLLKKELPFYSRNPFRLDSILKNQKKYSKQEVLKSLYNWHLHTFWEIVQTKRIEGRDGWVRKKEKIWK